jgi:O-acetylhomoserine/O-acetylserine sulfhydrylase-like pyridoxal-dependent enzyme
MRQYLLKQVRESMHGGFRGVGFWRLALARGVRATSRQFATSIGHRSVCRVNYPGPKGHPDHSIAERQMKGFGGMLSFELTDPICLEQVLQRFQWAKPALGLGGVETLVCLPAKTSHRLSHPRAKAHWHRPSLDQGLCGNPPKYAKHEVGMEFTLR